MPHHMIQGSPRLRQAVVQHLQGLWQSVKAPNLALERAWPDAAPGAQGCSHFRPQLGHLVCRRHSLVLAMTVRLSRLLIVSARSGAALDSSGLAWPPNLQMPSLHQADAAF